MQAAKPSAEVKLLSFWGLVPAYPFPSLRYRVDRARRKIRLRLFFWRFDFEHAGICLEKFCHYCFFVFEYEGILHRGAERGSSRSLASHLGESSSGRDTQKFAPSSKYLK
jgi:hypothetical protein